jgi:hypothetical protein
MIFALLGAAPAWASSLDLTLREDGRYLSEARRWRQLRLGLDLRQTTELSTRLKTVIKGRGWYDAALAQDLKGPFAEAYDKAVLHDEMYEAEAREAYVDYAGDHFTLRAGLQQIDWIDSLAPQNSDILTPIDLRFGGFGDASDVVVPQTGVLAGVPFGLDWQLQALLVPTPATDRLPVGENGYGYFEAIDEANGGRRQVEVTTRAIPVGARHAEGGLRLLGKLPFADVTLLGYHGYQRSPSYRLIPHSPQLVEIRQEFDEVNTYGLFFTRAEGAYTARLFAVAQPKRDPSQLKPSEPDAYDTLGRAGGGFDYVFSEALKVYTEAFYARTDHRGQKGDTRDEGYVLTYRAENESFDQWKLFLDGIYTGPERSYLWSPGVRWAFSPRGTATLGGRFVRSLSDRSYLDVVRHTSHAYASISYFFRAEEQQ